MRFKLEDAGQVSATMSLAETMINKLGKMYSIMFFLTSTLKILSPFIFLYVFLPNS